jgi:hypothetical protein
MSSAERVEEDMDPEDASDLRRAWAAAGNPPCEHNTLIRVISHTGPTGDYACTACGEMSDIPPEEFSDPL